MAVKRLTWKREPNERGLAQIGQGERGYDLRYDGEEVARVRPKSVGFHRWSGYYWVSRNDELGVPLHNTCGEPVGTMDEAKEACMAYVREHMQKEGAQHR